jgi:hypothetical protein
MKTRIALLSSLPFLAAGTIAGVAPADAAIIGTLEISGANIEAVGTGQTDPRNPNVPTSTIDFGFIGDRTPEEPNIIPGLGEFSINSADGVFGQFGPPPPQVGRVVDLPDNGSFFPVDNFLSFASNFGNTPPVTDPSQFNTFFDLDEFDVPVYTQTERGINVNFDVAGTFTLPDGRVVDGEGIVGGEVLFSSQPGTPFNDLDSFLSYISTPGNAVNVDSWSGNFNAEEDVVQGVPEPATALGLVAVGTLAAATMKRKQRS